MSDLSTFKKIARQIVEYIREGRTVTIKPSAKVADDFEAALDLVEKEQSRLKKLKENGGRPRIKGEVSRNTQWMRDYRERQKAAGDVNSKS